MYLLLIVLALVVGTMAFIGLSLPKEMVFEKETIIEVKVCSLFEKVSDVKGQENWRSDVKSIEIHGDGSWTEHPAKGRSLTFRIKRKEACERFDIEIIAPTSFQGYWEGRFEPVGPAKTKINFKEVVVVNNPFSRLIVWLFVDIDATMELYLNDLKKSLIVPLNLNNLIN